jgi:hypothetical protein
MKYENNQPGTATDLATAPKVETDAGRQTLSGIAPTIFSLGERAGFKSSWY